MRFVGLLCIELAGVALCFIGIRMLFGGLNALTAIGIRQDAVLVFLKVGPGSAATLVGGLAIYLPLNAHFIKIESEDNH